MKEGDYMFIEFGHNDQKLKGPGKGAYYSFASNLKYFVDVVRAKGGIPVFVTPTQRRSFDNSGKYRKHTKTILMRCVGLPSVRECR